IEARADDSNARVRELLRDIEDPVVEELRLVDADDVRGRDIDERQQLGGRADGRGLLLQAFVADDLHVVVAIVDARLEQEHALLGETGAFDPTDQLLGLPAEHRAADDLDASESLETVGEVLAVGPFVKAGRHLTPAILGTAPDDKSAGRAWISR